LEGKVCSIETCKTGATDAPAGHRGSTCYHSLLVNSSLEWKERVDQDSVWLFLTLLEMEENYFCNSGKVSEQ